MQFSPQSPDHSRCPVCRAEVPPSAPFCGACGSRLAPSPAQEILNLNYLLAELARWEAEGVIEPWQTKPLHEAYELKREELRSQLSVNGNQAKQTATQPEANIPAEEEAFPRTAGTNYQESQDAAPPPFVFREAIAPLPTRFHQREAVPQRTLLEKLTDPHTIRVLLYTGAAMLVVGVIIWLRDILYLKLQEPIVQAGLLAFGTVAVTVTGWLITLRTRLRITGRALTLIGSLLVPVNFWFLVRSGLIENNGRAWMVCALCTMLYAHTAALLREKLYVYLASVAAIATAWTLVYRYEREALGLYAVTLTIISLAFLHLSRLFPRTTEEGEAQNNPQSEIRIQQSRLGYELWGGPLVHVALSGVTLAALSYMPWRLGSSPSFARGVFRLTASEYDSSVAMLLFAGLGYAVWFAGRYIYAGGRTALYITSTLALFWTEFLALDGLQLSGQAQALILAASALAVAVAARLIKEEVFTVALHRASLAVNLTMAVVVYALISNAPSPTLTHGVTLLFIAATFAVASAARLGTEAALFSHASAICASAAFLVSLLSFRLESGTVFFAACAVWPFMLYAVAALALSLKRETQLAAPYVRVADAEAFLLLLIACALTFGLDQELQYASRTFDRLLGANFSLLSGAVLYGWLRSGRGRSVVGAALMSIALIVLVVAAGDALKYAGVLPMGWPVASAVIIAAFLMREAAQRLIREESVERATGQTRFSTVKGTLTRAFVIGVVADCATVAAASLWLASAVYHFDEGGTSAAVVLLLALLYWGERAARLRQEWTAYVCSVHAGALLIALLIALRVEARWFASVSVLILFPVFFIAAKFALTRATKWVAGPASISAGTVLLATAGASLLQALAHLQVSDPLLLAPAVGLGAVALLSFAASFWSQDPARVRYFRAGLSSTIFAFALLCLRAGFDPVSDVEVYSTPVAVLLLAVAYLSSRRGWEGYETDVSFLLWAGSLLLSAPLLLHALNYRLMDVPAPWRDLATLCASLALILLGVVGRLRAPLIIGAISLASELAALTVTSVDWLQIPLKVYLISVGALILLIWGGLEFRREQILRLRQRLNERREYARERFGEWR